MNNGRRGVFRPRLCDDNRGNRLPPPTQHEEAMKTETPELPITNMVNDLLYRAPHTVFSTEKGDVIRAVGHLESRLRAAEEALRELHTRTESFWALVQGEYGVKLSSADHEDHNVYEFFAAMDAARRLVSHEGEKGE